MSLKNTVKELLDEACHNTLQSAFFNEEIDCGYGDDDELGDKLRNLSVAFECVEQHGGEGEGEDFYTVYKFTKGDEVIFVKFQGWYQSYNGSEMTDWAFVTPKQVMVTVYG
jgi:hypothetical protein